MQYAAIISEDILRVHNFLYIFIFVKGNNYMRKVLRENYDFKYPA